MLKKFKRLNIATVRKPVISISIAINYLCLRRSRCRSRFAHSRRASSSRIGVRWRLAWLIRGHRVRCLSNLRDRLAERRRLTFPLDRVAAMHRDCDANENTAPPPGPRACEQQMELAVYIRPPLYPPAAAYEPRSATAWRTQSDVKSWEKSLFKLDANRNHPRLFLLPTRDSRWRERKEKKF